MIFYKICILHRVYLNFSGKLFEGVEDPFVIVFQNTLYDKVIIQEEVVGEKVIISELRRHRWYVELLQHVVIGLTIGLVTNCLNSITLKCRLWEFGSVPNFVKNGLNIWVLFLELVWVSSIVRPNKHGSIRMEVVSYFDVISILVEHSSHGFCLWFRKRVWTRVRL